VGLLPQPEWALWVWFAVNLVAVAAVAIGLTRLWPVPPGGATASDNFRLVLAALLLFPATSWTLDSGQFALLVLGLLLVATDPSLHWLPRGVALGVALIKPSIAMPFLFLPLVRGEWRVLLIAAAVQVVPGAYVVLQTGETVALFRDWLAVSRYFLQGMYTLQEWLNLASPRVPWITLAGPLAVLAVCGVTLFVGRHLSRARLFSLAAVTSVFWMYHGYYDFVVLLPVLLPLAGWSDQQPAGRWSVVGIVVFAVFVVALLPAVALGEDIVTRCIRWLARFTLLGLVVREYVAVYWGVFRPGDPNRRTAGGDPAVVTAVQASSSG
jgi:hypothetical protein